MKILAAWIGILTLGVLTAHTLAAEPAAVVYRDLRYEDDLSGWLERPRADVWNPVKHMALSGEGDTWLSIGGQLRLRGEHWENFAFGPANDDDVLLARLRVHGDLHAGEHLRLFVEGISATLTRRDLPGGRRTIDEDRLDLQNAFVDLAGDVGATKLTLRGGRQELSYGKQRLVSPLDWVNTRRTFDGLRLIAERGEWRVDAFSAHLVEVKPHDLNGWDSNRDLSGVYATGGLGLWGAKADVYWLYQDNDQATYDRATGDEQRHTAGGRLAGAVGGTGIDYDLEGDRQWGEVGRLDVEAWSIASQVGISAQKSPGKPRVYLGYDYASGDDNPADKKVRTFSQVYPLGHAYLGYIDLVGRQNVADTSAGISFKPCAYAVVRIDGHCFQRAERTDALYNAGGAIVRKGDAGTSRDVGRELDLTLVSPLGQHAQAQVGYSRFWAGDFIDQSGAGTDIDFAYAQMQYTF